MKPTLIATVAVSGQITAQGELISLCEPGGRASVRIGGRTVTGKLIEPRRAEE